MIGSFDVEKLYPFLQSFYTAVGIRISVFDDEFRLVAEYPTTAPDYCKMIRKTEQGKNGCRLCDENAFKTVRKSRKAYVYTCHAGLTEAVAPVKLGDGIVGYVILAHMLPKETYEEAFRNALKKAESYGWAKELSLPALQTIKAHSIEKIDACVQLLEAVAAYLQIADFVKWKTQDFASKISEYVEANLSQNINSDALCKKFFISRTKLYQICTESYGMSISRYVTLKRLEQAKKLLVQNVSVTEIAERTGFSDGNYFSKVFKKETGYSPTAYKKKMQ